MASTVLRTHALGMHFGGMVALEAVNFRLHENELRCLIGPNGAGKSTFFKCLTGMLTPSSGEIYIQGEECTGLLPHEIARLGVGIKTQVPSVMDGLSVFENLWLAAHRVPTNRQIRQQVDEVLERLEITDLSKQIVGRLAHGKRQLVEFGMVLAMRPWLVLLDEPAAGMTHAEVERAARIILEINRTATLIVVEHDMHFIRLIAKNVTVFHQGKVLVEDTVDNVMSNPLVQDVYLGKAM